MILIIPDGQHRHSANAADPGDIHCSVKHQLRADGIDGGHGILGKRVGALRPLGVNSTKIPERDLIQIPNHNNIPSHIPSITCGTHIIIDRNLKKGNGFIRSASETAGMGATNY